MRADREERKSEDTGPREEHKLSLALRACSFSEGNEDHLVVCSVLKHQRYLLSLHLAPDFPTLVTVTALRVSATEQKVLSECLSSKLSNLYS